MSGFNWDGESYTEGAGGAFIKENDFDKLIFTDAVVQIIAVREGISPGFQGGPPKPQYLVDFIAPDGEEYTKGLTKGIPERDARMERFKATLEASGEPIESTPCKVGRRKDFGPPKASA